MKKIKYYGQQHAQEVLVMLEDMHHFKEKYQANNVHIPRGILLIGAPGMGKTLFAYKVAEVLQKELLIIKPSSQMLSEEIEEKFSLAREKKNCIVLLDEVFNMIYKDEKTEGQLLSELDSTSDFLVIATTSAHEYELESHEALTRPGRFDIKINLGWPTYEDRLEFFKDQLALFNIDYDYEVLAEITYGESYAFFTSFINHIKMYAIHQDKEITHEFVYALKEKLSGFAKQNQIVSKESLYDIAVHELGHAVYGILVGRQVSLVELSKSGYRAKTIFEATDERAANEYLNDMAISLSGYVAGLVVNDKHVNGAELDFEDTRNSFSMLYRGTLLIHHETSTLFSHIGPQEQLTSYYRRLYKKTMKMTYKNVYKALKLHKDVIIEYANVLIEKSILTKNDIEKIKSQLKKRYY